MNCSDFQGLPRTTKLPSIRSRGTTIKMTYVNDSSTRKSLLQRVKDRSNQAAWSEFVVLYTPHIYAWAGQYGLQSSDRENVAQEVLLRMVKLLPDFEYNPKQTFRGFLRTITRNAAIDALRSQRDAGTGGSAVLLRLNEVAAAESLPEFLRGPFDRAVMEKAESQVNAEANPVHWIAYLLRKDEGKTFSEIADELNNKIGNDGSNPIGSKKRNVTPNGLKMAVWRITKQVRDAVKVLNGE